MPSTSPSPSPSVPRVFPLSSDYLLRVSRTSDATVFFEDSRPHSPNSPNSPTAGATVAICLPSIGDTRRQFRLLAPLLHDRLGWRVLLGDLRGFGDSTGRFEEATINDKSDSYPTFSPESVAADVTQLMTELHTEDPTTRFVLLGNSLAAGSMVLAVVHARASALNGHIRGLVLLGPVLRDAPMVAAVFRVVAPVLFNSLWGNGVWTWYYRSLYPVRQPSDLDSEIEILRKHLKDNRRGITNTRYFMNAREDAVESAVAKLAPEVAVVAFLGRKDPDYPDADKEGEWIKSVVPHATVSMEDDCGHYPHLEDPEKVFAAIAKTMS